MKRYSILIIGIAAAVLILGGMAYGEGGMDSPAGQGETGGMSSDQSSGMGGAGGMQGKVDINTASVQELENVPGMTRTMARDIVKYRDQNGPFTSAEELLNVKSMDQAKLDNIRSSITIGGAEPMSPGGGGMPDDTGGGMGGGTSGGSSGY